MVGLFLVSLPLVTPYLRGDGIGYYSYVSSLIIDRDLDFTDEYSHVDPGNHRNYFDENGNIHSDFYTSTGKIANKYSVGPSLFWSPFFILAHIFALVSVMVAILVFWNFGFIFQWGANMIPNRGPISWRTMIRNQFTAVPVRATHMAKGFFTSRTKIIKRIESEDLEEIKQYKSKR